MNDKADPFDTLTRMEELLRKNRGLSYLMSRALVLQVHQPDPMHELDASGVQSLSDDLTSEMDQAYVEHFHACQHAGISRPPVLQVVGQSQPR